MKRRFFIAIFAISVILALVLSGCTQQVVCNKPYIQVGAQCCLDQNNNSVCDNDEAPPTNITSPAQNITPTSNITSQQNVTTNVTTNTTANQNTTQNITISQNVTASQNITTQNITIQNVTPSQQRLTNDFELCSGMDSTQTIPVAYHRILLAKSNDGLNFTRWDKLITDRASVPDIMLDKDGNVRVYFVLLSCKEQGINNQITAVAISYDNGESWIYKKIVVDAPSDATFCKQPGGQLPPVDPEVLLMPDGTYRLYATCPRGSMTGTPMTYVFFSSDGINFSGAKHTFEPTTAALDPVVIKFGSVWNMFNGNSGPSTSQDGITFTQTTTGIFCPFKFSDGSMQKCYVIGDAMTLANPVSYRIYLFGDTSTEKFKSIISTDGENWNMEQSSGAYLFGANSAIDSTIEYSKLMFPTVVKLNDGSYLMAYETFIPGTPSSMLPAVGPTNQPPPN